MVDIPNNQGAVKLSEIFTDSAVAILQTLTGNDAMSLIAQMNLTDGDTIRKNSFILFSEGTMSWQGAGSASAGQISFNFGSVANNVILRLLQTEPGFPAHIDLTLQGSIGGNTTTTFQNINLNNGDLLYLELDRTTLANCGGTLVIQNAVGGGSLVSGATLRSVNLLGSAGMPSIENPIGGPTQTCYIPLAMRWDYGTNDQSNVYWIPHGIMWPSLYSATSTSWSTTSSFLGAIIVAGNSTLPDYFVTDQPSLLAALTALSSSGGIVCVNGAGPIAITQNISVPANVEIIGKSWTRANFLISPGGGFTLGNQAIVSNCWFQGSATLNGGQALVSMPSIQSVLDGCQFTLQNTSGSAYCINVTGVYNRIRGCYITGVVPPGDANAAFQNGIVYAGGSSNADVDTYIT